MKKRMASLFLIEEKKMRGGLVKDCNLFNLSFLFSLVSLFKHQSQEDSVQLVPFHCSTIQATGSGSQSRAADRDSLCI